MQRGGNPEPVAQDVKLGINQRRHCHAFGKGGLQRGTRADDMPVDRLTNAACLLQQKLGRYRVNRLHARQVRQHNNRQCNCQQQYNVRNRQHLAQGQPEFFLRRHQVMFAKTVRSVKGPASGRL